MQLDASHPLTLLPIGTDTPWSDRPRGQASSSRPSQVYFIATLGIFRRLGPIPAVLDRRSWLSTDRCRPRASSVSDARPALDVPRPSPEYFRESRRIVDGDSDVFGETSSVLDPRDMTPVAFDGLRPGAGGPGLVDPPAPVGGRRPRHPRSRRLGCAVPGPAPAAGSDPRPAAAADLEHVATSEVDGFQKLLFRTADGLAVETVLIPLHKPGAVSVCLSSQVGCAMGCVFCATARMPRRRNLETWEIIDQFVQARELVRAQGRRVTGAVFMGMGEPFLNYDRVLAAAELLVPVRRPDRCQGDHDQHGRPGPRDRPITPPRRAQFRLSISLGAATDEKRADLVPSPAGRRSPR